MSKGQGHQGTGPAGTAPGGDREARLKAALKANLARRKAQIRARAASVPEASGTAGQGSGADCGDEDRGRAGAPGGPAGGRTDERDG